MLVNVPSWEGRFPWGGRRCSGTSVDAMAVKHRGCTKRHSRVLQISCSASFISVQNQVPPVERLPHFGKPVLTGAQRLPQRQALRACAQNTGQCGGCQSHARLPAPIRGLFLQHHTALTVEVPPLQSPRRSAIKSQGRWETAARMLCFVTQELLSRDAHRAGTAPLAVAPDVCAEQPSVNIQQTPHWLLVDRTQNPFRQLIEQASPPGQSACLVSPGLYPTICW